MRNGSVIFDNGVHIHNLRDDNVIEPEGTITQNFFFRTLQGIKGPDYDYGEFASAWSAATVGELRDGRRPAMIMVAEVAAGPFTSAAR
jgi:hypothetical protein